MHKRSENRYYTALFEELERPGWVEGQNLTVEGFGREQNTSGLGLLAMEIVRSNPDVIYSIGPGVVSFKPATSRIPIVALSGDPIALGIAQSLAHPGGNFTGVSIDAGPSIHGKRIALLREMFPAMSKMGCLALRFQWNGPKAIAGPAISAAAEKSGHSSYGVLWSNLVRAKQTIERQLRVSPTTAQMQSWWSTQLMFSRTAP